VDVVPAIDRLVVSIFFLQPKDLLRVEVEGATGISFHLCW